MNTAIIAATHIITTPFCHHYQYLYHYFSNVHYSCPIGTLIAATLRAAPTSRLSDFAARQIRAASITHRSHVAPRLCRTAVISRRSNAVLISCRPPFDPLKFRAAHISRRSYLAPLPSRPICAPGVSDIGRECKIGRCAP